MLINKGMWFSCGYNDVNAIFFIYGRACPGVTLRKAFALWHFGGGGGGGGTTTLPSDPNKAWSRPGVKAWSSITKVLQEYFSLSTSLCEG